MGMLSTLAGGIGLFLLGMILLTEGLKSAAGSALRTVLARFTGGPTKAFLSGMGVAALVQSSSATTLSTIGFVSAGLLTFPQAVGVIFGANVGTTSTGWLVSLLGLNMSISVFALPLIGAGALMRLLASGRRASLGLALAGFGLIFVGVDTLQAGMASLVARVDPAQFQAAGFGGRLLLLAVGAVMTVVMQSSSAAVTATLTALHVGALRMEDAAVLVIGQNVGTTVKAALASIGATTPARRTALAHILFNVLTALLAFILLPLFLILANAVAAAIPGDANAIGLAAFHTAFNVLGVVVLLPFATRFAGWITRLVPERGTSLTSHLDPTVASVAPVAVEAVRMTATQVAGLLARCVRESLEPGAKRESVRRDVEEALEALAQARQFLASVRSADDVASDRHRHVSVLHVLDHLESLAEAIRDAEPEFESLVGDELGLLLHELRNGVAAVIEWTAVDGLAAPTVRVAALSSSIAEVRRQRRPLVMERTANGELDPDTALARLDALRRVDRMLYHIWRAVHHLELAGQGAGAGKEQPVAVESWSDLGATAPPA
jgi:phosphate:Na+ symporter